MTLGESELRAVGVDGHAVHGRDRLLRPADLGRSPELSSCVEILDELAGQQAEDEHPHGGRRHVGGPGRNALVGRVVVDLDVEGVGRDETFGTVAVDCAASTAPIPNTTFCVDVTKRVGVGVFRDRFTVSGVASLMLRLPVPLVMVTTPAPDAFPSVTSVTEPLTDASRFPN